MHRVDIREGESVIPHLKEHGEIYGHRMYSTGVHYAEYKILLVSTIPEMRDYFDPNTFDLLRVQCLHYKCLIKPFDGDVWEENDFYIPEHEIGIIQKLTKAYDRAMGIL